MVTGAILCIAEPASRYLSSAAHPETSICTGCGLFMWALGLSSMVLCFWPDTMRLELWLGLILIGAGSFSVGSAVESCDIQKWGPRWEVLHRALVAVLALGGVTLTVRARVASRRVFLTVNRQTCSRPSLADPF